MDVFGKHVLHVVTATMSRAQSPTCNDLQAGDAGGHLRYSRRHQLLVEVDKRVLGQPRPVQAVPEVFLQQTLQHGASTTMTATMRGRWRPVLWNYNACTLIEIAHTLRKL